MPCVFTPLHVSSLNTLGCAVLGVGTFPDIFQTSKCSFQGSTHWRHPINSCTKYEPILSSAVCIWESSGVRITICRVIKFLGLRACALPVCIDVHATAFSPSACIQDVCLCHSCVSCTLSSPLALAISMCLERSWDVSAVSFLSTPRALPKYHCSETAQPSYSIKSAVLHRPCDPGLAPGLLFSFLHTSQLLKDRIVDFLAFVGLCISYLCPNGSLEMEGLLLSLALGGVHRTVVVCSRLSE